MWENANLITDYAVRCVAGPPLLIVGVALPRFASNTDPYAQAVEEALTAFIELKRRSDPWYAVLYVIDKETVDATVKPPGVQARDAPSAQAMNLNNGIGFQLDLQSLRRAVTDPGHRELAAPDLCTCIDRLVEMTSRVSGPRHLFVFFTAESAAQAPIQRLAQSLRSEAVTLHGFAAAGLTESKAIRDLCAPRNGSFQAVPVADLPRAVSETYLSLLSRYEIRYHKEPAVGQPVVCDLRVSSPLGCGQLTIEFRPTQTLYLMGK